jgi:hypothetical protein
LVPRVVNFLSNPGAFWWSVGGLAKFVEPSPKTLLFWKKKFKKIKKIPKKVFIGVTVPKRNFILAKIYTK